MSPPDTSTFSLGTFADFPQGDKNQSESSYFGQKPAVLLAEETHTHKTVFVAATLAGK